ncbi:MAG: sialidase family protein [Planctomycetota bacterium]|nr:sialidase family protein [Planctomycetota bacterium]MDP7252611.1 sialidase family protein [Planctomycetota bacterium]
MPSQRPQCSLSPERLITKDGTIIPQAARLADGRILVCYSVGTDSWFSPSGFSVSEDGFTWRRIDGPMHSVSAIGPSGGEKALLFDQYLWRTAESRYVAFCCEAREALTFAEPCLAEFHLEGALCKHYIPRPADDPDAFYEPKIPEFYRPVTERYGAQVGGHIFGSIIELPDGAMGLSAYCQMKGNTRRKDTAPSDYVGRRPDEGVADEATDDILWSAIFFRSDDEGRTWHAASTIAEAEVDFPFDAGVLYSEGFTEAGLSCTSEGKVYALVRHGSYMLLWRFISADGGRTWCEPMCFNYPGVAPSMCLLPNGMLAAAWGRPGMTVGFSIDGTGSTWDALVGVMQDDVQSQKYPWLVPIGENRVMLFYDKRKWDSERRVFYEHGIYCREITVGQ